MDHARAITSSSSRSISTSSSDAAPPPSTSSDSTASAASNKRKRSPQGCVVAANDIIVDELQKIKGKIRESSHLASNYGRAIFSIQNHTETITNAREAKQLRNIGNYIANQIQSILHKHGLQRQNNETASTTTAAAPRELPVPRPDPSVTSRPPVAPVVSTTDSTASRRPYVPAQGKQPWHVLRALQQEGATSEASAVTVNTLLSTMQTAGYDGTLPKLRVCITALLNTHQILHKTSNGSVYLNDRGIQSAQLSTGQAPRSQEQTNDTNAPGRSIVARPTAPAFVTTHGQTLGRTTETVCIDLSDSEDYDSDTAMVRVTSLSPSQRFHDEDPEPDAEPSFALLPAHRNINTGRDPLANLIRDGDEWEIVLVLDHREVLSRRNRDILERKLLDINVTCEVRSLNVGDVQWVARRYRNGESADEFMLNVIVERKEVKDLSGSIIDRRYNEQKTRLRDSGMTHVIYLVEGSLTQQTTVRSSGLQTAMCRTQVQNQFFVQQCQNADESVAFLRGVHMNLLSKLPASATCRNRERMSTPSRLCSSTAPTVSDWKRQFCLPLRTYTDFNAQFRKKADFTVGEIYQMMLMQVHSLSSSRTVALSAQYPTFQHLAKAIARGDKLHDIRYGESQRRMGAKSHEFLKFFVESSDYEQDTPIFNSRGRSILRDD